MMNKLRSFLYSILTGSLMFSGSEAADWFVATNGTPMGKGTRTSPWDISSALAAKQKVRPGDTLWLLAGVYKYPPQVGSQGFTVALAGTEQSPVHIRAWSGERVTLDGGLVVQPPATHVWIWDLEITVTEPRPEKPVPRDPTYKNVNRPWGGLNVNSGTGCKFINLVLHDNSQGASWWLGSKVSELYGCIIYDNGWQGTDRGHGHAVYTQNRDGTKTISDCIMTGGFGYTMHAYGSSRAYVDNYVLQRNICYNAGPFLVGGGKPSQHIQVLSNCLYQVSMQIGYTAPTNEDCVVRGNIIVNGGLEVVRYREARVEDNFILKKSQTRPGGIQVILHPNQYDPRRAYLAIYNWQKMAVVDADVSTFLKPGERFRLMDPRQFFGAPVLSGACEAGRIKVPMSGEFGAWVLLKER